MSILNSLRRLLLLCLLLPALPLHAQQPAALEVSGVQQYAKITRNFYYYIDSSGSKDFNAAALENFRPLRSQVAFSTNFMKRFFLLFRLSNTSQRNDTLLFYPGYVVAAKLAMWDSAGQRATELPAGQPVSNHFSVTPVGFIPVIVPPGTHTFLLQPQLRYYNWEQMDPTLVRKSSINNFIYENNIRPELSYILIAIFFIAVLCMMAVYAFIKYYQTRLPEYNYYGLSAFAFVLYFAYQLFGQFFPSHSYHSLSIFMKEFLQIAAHLLYMLFAIYFLDIRRTMPQLFRVMTAIFVLLIIYLVSIFFTSFSDAGFDINRKAFNLIRVILLLYSIYAIPVLFRSKLPLARYVAYGALSVSVFAAIAFYYSSIDYSSMPIFFYIGGPIVFFKLGILIEQVIFLVGLSNKARREADERIKDMQFLKIENEKKEIEKFMAIMETRDVERTRIAQEIHDDMGSGLTSIRLLSEIAKAKMGDETMIEMDKISSSASELVDKMNEIIWSINTKNDSLANLVAYIRSHIVSYFEPFDTLLHIALPDELPGKEISGEYRRNIFLVVKESLHNIVKHAQAKNVWIDFSVGDELLISIRDDGKGCEQDKIKPYSNGVRNMRERMEYTGGRFIIESEPGRGTHIRLFYPLA
jgi:signal transduction histidine kinase